MHTSAAGARPASREPTPSFSALGAPPAIVAALRQAGVETPFPIQVATLPDALAGRDVIARGRTGSGKTIAFAVPTIARLAAGSTRARRLRPRALVLVPTRELAAQVAATFSPLARVSGLRVTTVYGGVSQRRQVDELQRGCDVLVACPGRLEDLIGQGLCHLDDVEITVLDEADHLADLGFLPAVRRLLNRIPSGTQRLLFSATIDRTIDTLVRTYLDRPVTHVVDPPAGDTAQQHHHVLHIDASEKAAVVRALARGEQRTLLFTRTKHGAKKLARTLNANGVAAVELHGNLSQSARNRNLATFSDGTTPVLVATDIAARGIHVDDVTLVVHVDPPAEHKAYQHRSGRTARAGASGTVVTLATPDQRQHVAALARQAGVVQHATTAGATHPLVEQLGAGTAAVPVAPSAPPVPSAPPLRVVSSGPAAVERERRPAKATDGARKRSARRRGPRRPSTAVRAG